jgi:hypothetical protein
MAHPITVVRDWLIVRLGLSATDLTLNAPSAAGVILPDGSQLYARTLVVLPPTGESFKGIQAFSGGQEAVITCNYHLFFRCDRALGYHTLDIAQVAQVRTNLQLAFRGKFGTAVLPFLQLEQVPQDSITISSIQLDEGEDWIIKLPLSFRFAYKPVYGETPDFVDPSKSFVTAPVDIRKITIGLYRSKISKPLDKPTAVKDREFSVNSVGVFEQIGFLGGMTIGVTPAPGPFAIVQRSPEPVVVPRGGLLFVRFTGTHPAIIGANYSLDFNQIGSDTANVQVTGDILTLKVPANLSTGAGKQLKIGTFQTFDLTVF